MPLILLDPAEALTCYEHGRSTALARNKPFPFLEEATLRWCAMQSAWTGWCFHLVPLLFAKMNSPLLEMLGSKCQCSHYPFSGREDGVPKWPVPFRNTPVICSIVCPELQVKYTSAAVFCWLNICNTIHMNYSCFLLKMIRGRHRSTNGSKRLTTNQNSTKAPTETSCRCAECIQTTFIVAQFSKCIYVYINPSNY